MRKTKEYSRGASFIKCWAETILKLILRSSLKYAYMWFLKWTYVQKTHVRISFRCEIFESQMILNLRANEWFQFSACKQLLINVINVKDHLSSKSFHLEQRAARTAYIFKNLQYLNKKKCVRLLRPWRDAKHFSTSKPVFTNMSVDMD